MDDVGIVEAADHVDDSVHLADVGEELVAQALALGGALYQTGDVHEFDHGGGGLGGIVHGCQLVEAGVRNRNDAYVGIDGAERVVGGFGAGFCQ